MSAEKQMISQFVGWFKANAERFIVDSVQAQVREPELATVECAGIDFETEYVLAIINIWGWGDCEVIIVCKATSETILADDLNISSPAEIFPTLDRYYNRIVNQSCC